MASVISCEVDTCQGKILANIPQERVPAFEGKVILSVVIVLDWHCLSPNPAYPATHWETLSCSCLTWSGLDTRSTSTGGSFAICRERTQVPGSPRADGNFLKIIMSACESHQRLQSLVHCKKTWWSNFHFRKEFWQYFTQARGIGEKSKWNTYAILLSSPGKQCGELAPSTER